MCQSFGMSSAADYPRSLRGICSLWSTYPAAGVTHLWMLTGMVLTKLPNDILTQKSMKVWLKAILPLETSSHLCFIPEKCKEEDIKCTLVHQVHTYIFSDMNFLLAYNGKGLERIALVNTCSIKVSNYITCFKILFSNAQSLGQPVGSLTLYFHQQWWCRVIPGLPQPSVLNQT